MRPGLEKDIENSLMKFSYKTLRIRSESLVMDYYLVPWDTEILGRRVAAISRIKVLDSYRAGQQFEPFRHWRDEERIELCSCRIGHDLIQESDFLQQRGFRFVELNFRPVFDSVQSFVFEDRSVDIAEAVDTDKENLADMAGSIFKHGRFHQDPYLGAEIGDKRYRLWLLNGFSRPEQVVYKCMLNDTVVGFFVVEYGADKHCHWSLTGIAPGFSGRGVGTLVWKSMLMFHKNEGMESVDTSISSHNIAVLNLYTKLGFRFPMPQMTFHWHA